MADEGRELRQGRPRQLRKQGGGMSEPVLMQLRVPPQSVDAEACVLGGLLLDNGAWESVADILNAGDFYRSENRLIFAAISQIVNERKPADAITVFEHLDNAGDGDDSGGLGYIASLTTQVQSASNIRRYAEIVREHGILRRLVTVSDEIATAAFNPDGRTVAAIVDEAQAKITALSESGRSGGEWVSAHDGMLAHTEVLEQRAAGKLQAWGTGLSDLDEYLEGGLMPGNLVIVGARPSMGKTALGMTIGVHMAQARGVGMLSMEMSHSEVRDRLTAMLGNVSMSSVKRPSKGDGLKWNSVLDGVDRAKSLRFYVDDQGGLTLNQVRSKARALRRKAGIDVLVVDYIGLMSSTNTKENRNIQLGEISRGLKTLAKELQIAVLCLAQLNRKAEERADSMPQMSDLRDSGEIEQDADVILFIKRPIMANPELGDEWKYYAKLSIAKNRQGRCGVIDLAYIGEQTRFSGWGGSAPQAAAVKKTKGME
jgi:replicative DNA helicase